MGQLFRRAIKYLLPRADQEEGALYSAKQRAQAEERVEVSTIASGSCQIPPSAVSVSLESLQQKLQRLGNIPSLPAILFPLIRNLDEPVGEVDVRKIVELISHDESIAAQCLRMANSPLFGRWQNIDSIQAAVVALGINRVRDIATSCCVLKLLPEQCGCIDPRTFWEHSLGVAMVSRRLARRVGLKDPEKAYLAGLLHDIGIVANLLVDAEGFRVVAERALSQRMPFNEVEQAILGFDHCVSGMMLADHWRLTPEIAEVVRRHHVPERACSYRGLAAVVNVADLVCRLCGLGYGFNECKKPDVINSPGWASLSEESGVIKSFGVARFASEMDMYANEVRRLVGVLFRFER